MKSKLPPTVPKSLAKNHPGRQRDYSPSAWNDYFHEFQDVKVENGTFRVYKSSPTDVPDSPVLVMLHGGGYSALSWSVFSKEITTIINCQCLALDLRGHGHTETSDDDDLSADTLANDVINVIERIYRDQSEVPKLLIVGHSLGGAIAIHVAALNLLPTLVGIIVIDVVEGTAMESLSAMQSFLRSRPTHFKSIPNAIEWCVRSGQIRNIESAKVSFPGQIINTETKMLATTELPFDISEIVAGTASSQMSIPEDVEEEEETPTAHKFQSPLLTTENLKKYTWRIDLSRTEKFWKGWFNNLSDKFLNVPIPKLLILAGIDNLDKTLQIGQMQGKFQLQVLARTGHAVHEDQPAQVAETLGSYLVRNKFAQSKADFIRVMPQC